MALRLFLDSADPAAWAEWLPSGLFHGVTTNPTLLLRAGVPCDLKAIAALAHQALALGCREVHGQAWGRDAAELEDCGRQLAALAPGQLVVKLPVTRAGALAAARLIQAGQPVTFTACYEAPQVLVAAALGARYIAPYLGRIDDQGRDGQGELVAMQRCLRGTRSKVRLLVASLRNAKTLSHLAAEGLDTFTISPAVAAELFASSDTEEAAEQFERDARGPMGLG